MCYISNVMSMHLLEMVLVVGLSNYSPLDLTTKKHVELRAKIQGLITLRDVIFWLQLPEEFIETWAVNNQDRSVGCTWGNPTTLCGNIIAIVIDIYIWESHRITQ